MEQLAQWLPRGIDADDRDARDTGSRQGVTTETFERVRPLLFAIAYRMLALVSEAEDVIQDAFLRYERATKDGVEIGSLKSYLSAVVTRLAIDELWSARRNREAYVGAGCRILRRSRAARAATRRARSSAIRTEGWSTSSSWTSLMAGSRPCGPLSTRTSSATWATSPTLASCSDPAVADQSLPLAPRHRNWSSDTVPSDGTHEVQFCDGTAHRTGSRRGCAPPRSARTRTARGHPNGASAGRFDGSFHAGPG